MKNYYVYIMTNHSGTLYTGVTNDLLRRIFEHKKGLVPGFTKKYKIKQLLYFEETNDVAIAIEREKQIKGWLRQKKIDLIESINPEWEDLAEDWYDD
ncbi:MAG: GIY-YIG nuclease family protein [Anaerolineales bacterium]|nr:GIY-YIG nuclease family protein [Chloroflexota bacterium]MBL6982457.1 GIY-YIG nuclease family protein [Anaerolineales bacterium]